MPVKGVNSLTSVLRFMFRETVIFVKLNNIKLSFDDFQYSKASVWHSIINVKRFYFTNVS